jgi:amidase
MKKSAEELSCLVPDTFELPATASGTLTGKTFVAKDLFAVAGHTSSFGHPRWRETHTASKVTSPVITKLLEAGANLAGMAKLDQMAGSLVGNIGEGKAPLNSLYPDRFTGGSSSGSASAVAGDLVDFAIGTDTAGSVRVPAAACGIYGLRPTHGSISSEGVIPWAVSFDVPGILSKDLGLIRDVYKVLQEKIAEPTKITHILLPKDCLTLVSHEVAEVVIQVAEEFAEKHGCEIQESELANFIGESARDLFSRIAGRENWQAHGKWISENRQYLAPDLYSRMEIAERLAMSSEEKVAANTRERDSYTKAVSKIIIPGSVVVAPVLDYLSPLRNATAMELQDYRKNTLCLNSISGLSSLPEVVIPATISKSGLTYGVGFIGSKNADIAVLDFLTS